MENIRTIHNEKDHKEALKRIEEIFNAEEGTKEFEELEVLSILVEDFEDKHFKIDYPDPITAIQIRMNEIGLKQQDLVGVIGSKGVVSEVLNKKRHLSLKMIRILSEKLNIPVEVLIQDYELNGKSKAQLA